MPTDLPRRFGDRSELERCLQQLFPTASGGLSPWRGGWREAQRRLAAIDPEAYGRSRNHLEGAVTRLSPWIRHGVLPLAAMRDSVAAWRLRRNAAWAAVSHLLRQLAWRDYWQRLWRQLGEGIWHDREPLKTGHPPAGYAAALPADLAEGRTGLACIDGFVADLVTTGWLHNHARLWLAAYLVHWRRVRWQVGARWFLEHLLDGDPASNNLSWQWVASSFSARPYLFNRDNLERFSGGRFCRACPAAERGGAERPGGCPFEAGYEALEERLLGPGHRR
jgi:deoxyribodipyrimidine photo-lyase